MSANFKLINSRLINSILVTGIHRSGSTFIGQMLAQASKIIYIHEPFQTGLKFKNSKGPFGKWFEHLPPQDVSNYKKENVLRYLYHRTKLNKSDLLELKTKQPHKFKRSFNNILKKIFKHSQSRFLFKDPIAILSSEWLYENLDALKIIVIIRHPAAFVASIKQLKWNFDFKELTEQKDLEDLLKPFNQRIKNINKNNLIEVGTLLWNIIYSQVQIYHVKYRKEWMFIKYEDLLIDPELNFSKLFNYCDIQLTNKIARIINQHMNTRKSKSLKRNRYIQIDKWKRQLNKDEIQYIEDNTVSLRKYWRYTD